MVNFEASIDRVGFKSEAPNEIDRVTTDVSLSSHLQPPASVSHIQFENAVTATKAVT